MFCEQDNRSFEIGVIQKGLGDKNPSLPGNLVVLYAKKIDVQFHKLLH